MGEEDNFNNIETNKHVLQLFGKEGIIDYARPLWLNLDHLENREFMHEKKFNSYIVPTTIVACGRFLGTK